MGEEEIVLLSDKELDTYIGKNYEADLMRELRKLPTLTAEENIELAKEYANCEEGSKEKITLQNRLIEGNMRLIVSIALKRMHRAKSFKLLDLVHEGVIGFIKGLKKFDPNLGYMLSTYVVNWIRHGINRAIMTRDKKIRIPDRWEQLMTKYTKLVDSYNALNRPLPEPKELALILNTNESMIKKIQKVYMLDPTSLDMSIDDDEKTEMYNFAGTSEQGYDDVLSDIVTQEYFKVLKNNLSKKEYFVFYYRKLAEEPKDLRYIGSKMFVSYERVRQIEERAQKKINAIFSNERVLSRELARARRENSSDNESIYPINTSTLPVFYFIKDTLTLEERELYILLVFSFDTIKETNIAKKMNIGMQEYNTLYDGLLKKINHFRETQFLPIYSAFKRIFIQMYGMEMLDFDLELSKDLYESSLSAQEKLVLKDIEDLYNKVSDVFTTKDNMSRKLVSVSLNKLIEDIGDTLDPQVKNLIKRYFSFTVVPSITKTEVEREINAITHGYKNEARLPKGTLYETLLKNRENFYQEQFDCLLCFKFGKMKKKEFRSKYPKSIMKTELPYLESKLERIYFALPNSYTYNFTKQKYSSIRELCLERNLVSQVEVLDLFFGVSTPPHSIDEIAKKFNLDYTSAHNLVRTARENCLSCWLKNRDTDKTIYIPYLEDDSYYINDRAREFAKTHLVEGKSPKEIGDPIKLTPQQVSNIINDCLRQIDFYRFGLRPSTNSYTKETRETVLEFSRFSEEQKNIIRVTLKVKSYKRASKILDIDLTGVKKTMNKFFDACYKYSVESVSVSENMIEEEIRRHKRDTVLSDEEGLVLLSLYGIKCDLNPDGEKLSSKDIQLKYGFSIDKVSKLKMNGLRSIAARSIGLKIPPLAPIDRDKLYHLLKGPCTPIDSREKEILSYYFELDGYPIKDIDELATMYKLSDDSIRRIIKRAFVSIIKYDLGEIEGTINFKDHVLPNLKYFPKSDQAILIDHYRDSLSLSQIGKIRGLSRDQTQSRIYKLKIQLKDILEGNIVGFDYDYFEEHVMDEDVPFYGDKELVYKMWYLLYEEKHSKEDIINELGLNIGVTKVQRDIDILMCAVLKRKRGIKKSKEFSYREIRDYYLAHESTMLFEHKVYYYRYFERKDKWKDAYAHISRTTSDVSLAITCDLLKDSGNDYISLDSMTKEQALDFIKKNRSKMSKGCLSYLAFYFNFQGKDFMSGSDKNKVMRALSSLGTGGHILKMHRD